MLSTSVVVLFDSLRTTRMRPPSSLAATPDAARKFRRAMRIWVDCTAAAHPLVLRPIVERLRERGHEVEVTAREYGQTDRHPRAARDPSTRCRRPRRRLRPPARPARSRAGSRALARWARPRRFDLALGPRLGRPRRRLARCCGSPRCRCRTTSTPACSARSASAPRAGCSFPTRSRSRPAARRGRRGQARSLPGLKEDYYLADFEPDPAVLGRARDRPRARCSRSSARRPRPRPTTRDNPLYDAVIERLAGRRGDDGGGDPAHRRARPPQPRSTPAPR